MSVWIYTLMPPGHGLNVGTDVHDLEVGSSLPPGDAQDHSDHQTWQQLPLPTELINFGFFFFLRNNRSVSYVTKFLKECVLSTFNRKFLWDHASALLNPYTVEIHIKHCIVPLIIHDQLQRTWMQLIKFLIIILIFYYSIILLLLRHLYFPLRWQKHHDQEENWACISRGLKSMVASEGVRVGSWALASRSTSRRRSVHGGW